jgi:hypothetical protein
MRGGYGPELCCSLGAAALVGGLCALAYGLLYPRVTHFLGHPFGPPDYCFLGSVLAAAGTGLGTFGLLLIRRRHPPAEPGRDERP